MQDNVNAVDFSFLYGDNWLPQVLVVLHVIEKIIAEIYRKNNNSRE
jgi:hypothetical protein